MYDREKARLKRIEIFEDTLKRCEEDPYLKQAVHDAKKTTWVYLADDYPLCGPPRQFETEITVTKHRTFEAAEALKAADPTAKIAVLNFANAFYPGRRCDRRRGRAGGMPLQVFHAVSGAALPLSDGKLLRPSQTDRRPQGDGRSHLYGRRGGV